MILGTTWAYVCPQKTATASVRLWLRQNYGGREHWKYHGRQVPPGFDLVFMTVRNPYERLFSLWNVRTGRASPGVSKRNLPFRDLPFEETCKHYAEIGQRLIDFRDASGATVFLKAENLAEEVRKLPFVHPDDPGPGHVRQNTGKAAPTFDDYFGEAERAIVRHHFAPDFDAFGYDV